MWFYTDFNNLTVAVCARHQQLADDRGWSLIDYDCAPTNQTCYFCEEE